MVNWMYDLTINGNIISKDGWGLEWRWKIRLESEWNDQRVYCVVYCKINSKGVNFREYSNCCVNS